FFKQAPFNFFSPAVLTTFQHFSETVPFCIPPNKPQFIEFLQLHKRLFPVASKQAPIHVFLTCLLTAFQQPLDTISFLIPQRTIIAFFFLTAQLSAFQHHCKL
ncbi:Uncharacterized protein APZ42_007455, partial [Daphnia magna]